MIHVPDEDDLVGSDGSSRRARIALGVGNDGMWWRNRADKLLPEPRFVINERLTRRMHSVAENEHLKDQDFVVCPLPPLHPAPLIQMVYWQWEIFTMQAVNRGWLW